MRGLRGWRRLFPWRWWDPAETEPGPCEAATRAAARRIADEQLRRAHARAPEVARVARESREHRAENHFAELFDRSFRAH